MHLFEVWEALLWTEFRGGGGGNAAAAADDDDDDEDDSLGQRTSWYGITPYLVKKVPVLHEAQSFIILRQVTAFLTIRFAMRTAVISFQSSPSTCVTFCNSVLPWGGVVSLMLRVCTFWPCRQSMMSYSVAIMYLQPTFICGRCLLHPHSEDAPGIGDERTRINVVVVYGYDRYGGGGGGDFSDGNSHNGSVGHRGWNLWLLERVREP